MKTGSFGLRGKREHRNLSIEHGRPQMLAARAVGRKTKRQFTRRKLQNDADDVSLR